MELFYFDIEVAGQYKDFETFNKMDQSGAIIFMKKYEKMNWIDKYSSIDDAYLYNCCIVPTYGKIVCISFGYLDNGIERISSFYGDDEKDIVNKFNELLKKIEKKSFNLCGFRVLYYDIVFILHKLTKYGIQPVDIIVTHNKKPWEMRITDMSDDWRGKFAYAFSFEEMCYELGVKSSKTKMDGSLVHEYYHAGRLEEIKDYCEMDVSSSIDAGLKLYK